MFITSPKSQTNVIENNFNYISLTFRTSLLHVCIHIYLMSRK